MKNPEEQMVLVPLKVAQSVLDYLKRRPFDEVHELVYKLVRAQPYNPPTEQIPNEDLPKS